MKSRPAGGMSFACRYSRITAAPNAEPQRKTTAKMAMTFGLAHPASSRRNIRGVTSLLPRFRVGGQVNKHSVSLLCLVSDYGNIDALFCDYGACPQMAVFLLDANYPSPKRQSQGQRRDRQTFTERRIGQ